MSILYQDDRLTEQCSELLKNLGLDDLSKKVRVVWNRRMRTTAGRAFWPAGRIELNPRLLDLEGDEVQGTLLHELAHLLAYARSGQRRIKPHGVEWQLACVHLGIPNERVTHSSPLQGRKMRRRWRYTCPSCGEGFDRVRKMKRYAACYHCCRKENGGYYHKKFRLVESALQPD